MQAGQQRQLTCRLRPRAALKYVTGGLSWLSSCLAGLLNVTSEDSFTPEGRSCQVGQRSPVQKKEYGIDDRRKEYRSTLGSQA